MRTSPGRLGRRHRQWLDAGRVAEGRSTGQRAWVVVPGKLMLYRTGRRGCRQQPQLQYGILRLIVATCADYASCVDGSGYPLTCGRLTPVSRCRAGHSKRPAARLMACRVDAAAIVRTQVPTARIPAAGGQMPTTHVPVPWQSTRSPCAPYRVQGPPWHRPPKRVRAWSSTHHDRQYLPRGRSGGAGDALRAGGERVPT